jgi:hypothetical protein
MQPRGAQSRHGLSPSPSLSQASVNRSPRAVIDAHLTAINKRDWPEVWQLGGKNLGPTYSAMIDGFRLTRKDMLLSFKSRGDYITTRIAAYETNGEVQDFALHYVIQCGVIRSGYQTLLSK